VSFAAGVQQPISRMNEIFGKEMAAHCG